MADVTVECPGCGCRYPLSDTERNHAVQCVTCGLTCSAEELLARPVSASAESPIEFAEGDAVAPDDQTTVAAGVHPAALIACVLVGVIALAAAFFQWRSAAAIRTQLVDANQKLESLATQESVARNEALLAAKRFAAADAELQKQQDAVKLQQETEALKDQAETKAEKLEATLKIAMAENERLIRELAEAKAENMKPAEVDLPESATYAKLIRAAHAELEQKNLDKARELLKHCQEQERGWEWRLLSKLAADRKVLRWTLPVEHSVDSMKFSPDSRYLLLGSDWKRSPTEPTGDVKRIPRNQRWGQVVRVLDGSVVPDDGSTFPGGSLMAAADSGRLVAFGSPESKIVALHRIEDKILKRDDTISLRVPPASISFQPRTTRLLALYVKDARDRNRLVTVVDSQTGKTKWTFPGSPIVDYLGIHQPSGTCQVLTRREVGTDGQAHNRQVVYLDLATGKEIRRTAFTVPRNHWMARGVNPHAPDATWFATYSGLSTASLQQATFYRIAEDSASAEVAHHIEKCRAIGVTPDGRCIISAQFAPTDLHDAPSGQILFSLPEADRPPEIDKRTSRIAIFNSTGDLLAVSIGDRIQLYDISL